MALVQKDIDFINDVGNKFFGVAMGDNVNMAKFLNLSKNLY
jgi:hypothetical protein